MSWTGPATTAHAAQPASACPAGATYQGGKCVSPTVATCDAQHKLVSGKCVAPATTVCAKGTLQNGACTLAAQAQCPAPSQLDGATCSGGWKAPCPTGFTNTGSACRAPATTTCPSGGTLTGMNCTVTVPRCATGFTLEESGTTCEKTIRSAEQPPASACPGGTIRNIDSPLWGCEVPVAACPSGGSRTAGTENCVYPGTVTCARGTSVIVNGAAFCQVQATDTCPAGLHEVGEDDCEGPPTYTCPAGFTLSGQQCTTPPTYSCADGSAPVGQQCITLPTAACKSGTLVAGHCVANPSCPTGTTVDASGKCQAGKHACPTGTKPDAAGRCMPTQADCPGGVCKPAPCPAGTTKLASGECLPAPPVSDGAKPVVPAAPTGRGLVVAPDLITVGDAITARGAGCSPGSTVVLTADGAEVGRTVADAKGGFTTPLEFTAFKIGSQTVVATCGPVTTTTRFDMAAVSSSGATSRTSVMLIFFVLAGFLLVQWQYGGGARRR